MRSAAGAAQGFEPDGMLTFDRLTSVYHSSVRHEEDQPVHLRIADMDICAGACAREYGNPCQYFCPAAVYELVEENAGKRLHINAANCLHCKACDILDPYQVITWVPPEGGGGPRYEGM
ncbi:MAG: 4Fe-4S dicluster domain-containing protein, partial [Gammaproteobacteria bacterium]